MKNEEHKEDIDTEKNTAEVPKDKASTSVVKETATNGKKDGKDAQNKKEEGEEGQRDGGGGAESEGETEEEQEDKGVEKATVEVPILTTGRKQPTEGFSSSCILSSGSSISTL